VRERAARESRAGPARHERHAVLATQAGDGGDLLGGVRYTPQKSPAARS